MNPALLACQRVCKSFAGVSVLKQVDLTVSASRVLGLVGENGAGKSTLMNILGGVLPPDDGAMLLDGKLYLPANPAAAAQLGVRVVHQELNLFPNLTLAENLFLDRLPRGLFGINRRVLHDQARKLLARVRLRQAPRTPVELLAPGERQLLEIAKALRDEAKLIIFDEPTTSLTQPEAAQLFEIIGELREQSVAIIYISHQLDDVFQLADDVVVLRDGEVQSAGPTASFSVASMIRHMVGRDVEQDFPERPSRRLDAVALEARHLRRAGVIENVSFQVRHGEILGVAGLMGAGRTELARILFGLDGRDSGDVLLHGKLIASPTPALCRDLGMAFVTEDRRAEGLLPNAPVDDNILLASWPRLSTLGWLQGASARDAAEMMANQLGIAAGSRRRPASQLSGGNQQKAVFAKWLLRQPSLLILDEPTRGVDVGAKREIYQIIQRLTRDGAAILLISSEIEELLGLSDRVLVLRAGRLVGEFARDDFDRERILSHALGQEGVR